MKYMTSRNSVGLWLATVAALAQTGTGQPSFEVASVRVAEPLTAKVLKGTIRLGMTVDGARVDIASMSLTELIRTAYRLKTYQVSGPEWMSAERFDILAKIPEGAGKDLVPEMLQSLLAERFKLSTHRETKEHAIYALVVGKNGLKIQEAPPDPPASGDGNGPSAGASSSAGGGFSVNNTGSGNVQFGGSKDGKGVVTYSTSGSRTAVSAGGGALHLDRKMTMAALADFLGRFVDKPIVDMTELKGTYAVAMDIPMEDLLKAKGANVVIVGNPAAADALRGAGDTASDPSGSAIFAAIQQLGLKLEPRKSAMEILVVDHAEKAPTEN